jgi:hypothetical protein
VLKGKRNYARVNRCFKDSIGGNEDLLRENANVNGSPFVSINFGTETSKEGRLVTEQLFKATKRGLGNSE